MYIETRTNLRHTLEILISTDHTSLVQLAQNNKCFNGTRYEYSLRGAGDTVNSPW